MSGELFGEAMAERRRSLAALTESEFLALLAIVNRCKPRGRVASVGFEEVCDAIGFVDERTRKRCSDRTGRMVLKNLRDYGLIEVIQRGHKPRGKPAVAPIYRVADELKLVSSQVAQTNDGSLCSETEKLVQRGPEACATAPPLTSTDSALHVSTSHVSTSHGETSPSLRSGDGESFDGRAVSAVDLCAAKGCDRPADPVWSSIGDRAYCDWCYRMIKGLR